MNDFDTHAQTRLIGRRNFLRTVGVLAGTGLIAGHAGTAHGDTLRPLELDWRRALADQFLPTGADFTARPLQGGLEVWEAGAAGYMIVDATTQALLESSPSAASPYHGVAGELSYFGPGTYFAATKSDAVDLFTGERLLAAELKASSLDVAAQIHQTATPTLAPSLPKNRQGTLDLNPPKSGEIKSRITSYGYITGSHVYPNSSGICGWVAGSIVTRYWHARSSARRLLPTNYRNGTNMTSSPNFATYLQGTSGNGTWASPVHDRLAWNAKKQGVGFSSSWILGNIGMFGEVRNNRPVIVFGNFPVGNKKKAGHAVVAYGETTGGQLITHYGWKGYTNIVLNGGLVGSNTKFRLT